MSQAGTPAHPDIATRRPKPKKRSFLVQKSRRGPHQAKKSPRSRTSQSRPDKQVEEKAKPQVRGCRTLVLCGTGRQDSPGRGDGLGWTTSTPPDSNGVPRDVPNVSRGHRARFQPTKRSVLTRKSSRTKCPFSGLTRGRAARRSNHKPEESQRTDQNQSNLGLIGQVRSQSLTGRRWVRTG